MRSRRTLRRLPVAVSAGFVLGLAATVVLANTNSASAAQAPVSLGTAASVGVLAGSTVTNTGPSVITGDVGVSPGSAMTRFSRWRFQRGDTCR